MSYGIMSQVGRKHNKNLDGLENKFKCTNLPNIQGMYDFILRRHCGKEAHVNRKTRSYNPR